MAASWSKLRNIMLGVAFAGAATYYLPHTDKDYERVKDTAASQVQQDAALTLIPIGLVVAAASEYARRKLSGPK